MANIVIAQEMLFQDGDEVEERSEKVDKGAKAAKP